MPLATRHSPPATRHSPPAASHSPLATLHSSLAAALLAVAAGAANAGGAGFYRVERDEAGAWRLVDPAGEPTVWLGVDHVKFDGFRCEADGDRKYYRETNERQFGTPEAWATNTAERLRSWGFNGLGAGCNNALFKGSGLGRCVFLALGDSATAEKNDEEHWLSDNLHTPGTAFPNVFNPDFAEHCDREAAKACAPNRDDPEVLGYFIDNELAWEARRGGPAGEWGLFDNACAKPAGNTAREAVDAFLAARGLKVGDDIPIPVRMEFVEFVAERYFEITTSAIRRHDPNHLVLGCRFAGTVYPDEVFRAAGKFCDIVSINGYAAPIPDRNEMLLSYRDRYYPIAETLSKLGEVSGRPIMLTEWSFPAFDSGLPCLRGVGKRFDTQQERAWASALYARSVLSCPWVIGYDYFMWVDMPAKGISYRFPEDSNYGLVREDGREYKELTDAFAAIQRRDGLDFGEWRRRLATRGPVYPPPHTPLLAEDRLDAECVPAAAGSAPPAFSREGGNWRVANAAGLELSGDISGAREAPIAISWRGFEYGTLSASITVRGVFDPKNPDGYALRTHRVSRVLDAAWRETPEGRGVLALLCDLDVARMAVEVRVAPDGPSLHVDVTGLENTGKEALEITSIALLPQTPLPEATVAPKAPRPGFVHRPHCTQAWIDRASGRTLGALSDSPLMGGVDFASGEGSARRSAVRFTLEGRAVMGSRKLVLAPAARWTPPVPVHAIIRPGDGGEEDWNAFSKPRRNAAQTITSANENRP